MKTKASTEVFYLCAWERAAATARGRGMVYYRRQATYPEEVTVRAEQLDGAPHGWDAHPDRPRASWWAQHPVTMEIVGGGFDGIVPAMEAADAQLLKWGFVLFGAIRDPNPHQRVHLKNPHLDDWTACHGRIMDKTTEDIGEVTCSECLRETKLEESR